MPRLRMIAICGLLASAACGGSSDPPSSPPPGGGGERITGSERLGWGQSAADAAALATFRYAAYVDDNRVELTDVSCGPASSGFQCSSRMPSMTPGNHRIELVSFVSNNGVNLESGRSAALMVTMAAATAPADGDSAARTTIDQTTADGTRLRLASLTVQLESPTAVAFAADGRVFVAERRGRVRILTSQGAPVDIVDAGGVALDLPDAMMVGESAGGLLDLTLDPDFATNHFAYALYTPASPDGGPRFRLVRFREAGGRLGERVVLLDGIPASPERPAGSMGFGPDGKLYLALDDGGDPAGARAAASYSGKVLRLNADGTTPSDQSRAGPVYSTDYRSPRGFDWHPGTGALWIVDALTDAEQELRIIARDTPRLTRPTTRVVALPPQTGAASMAFYRGDLLPAFKGDLLVAADEGRHLLRVRFDTRDSTRVLASERLFEGVGAPVTLVTVAPDGAVYLGTDRALLRVGAR
jgi:aldose sugar dehydrogenase